MSVVQNTMSKSLSQSYWPADTSQPVMDLTLVDILQRAVSRVPDRLALVEGVSDQALRRRWNYRQMHDECEHIAKALLTHFKPGDHVAMWASNVPEWHLMLYACAMAGIVLVTVNPAYRERELRYVLDKADVVGAFVMPNYRGFDTRAAALELVTVLPKLQKVVCIDELDKFVATADLGVGFPSVQADDPCVIMFTSGTTGAQKGAIFHHRGIVNATYFTQQRGGLEQGGIFVNPMPMFHIGGLGHASVGGVAHMATHVIVPKWDVDLYLDLVETERGTYSLLVPTMIEAVLAAPQRQQYDLSSLRHFISGASVVESSLIRRTKEQLGCSICNVYGQTEMHGVVCAVSLDDSEQDQADTIGRPMPQVEVKIADPSSGQVLPLNQKGEICIRGYQNMLGYYNMPEETSKAVDKDNWLHSGDIGSMDDRGYLRITGRIKEMIIRGGENIYPREVENLLQEYPGIKQAVLVGVPDTYWGEQVAAIMIAEDPSNSPAVSQLHQYCREQLAAYKTPAFWCFVDAFPLTETGKVQKFALLEMIEKGSLQLVSKA